MTFVLHDEDHTLGNSLRYMIMKTSVSFAFLFLSNKLLLETQHIVAICDLSAICQFKTIEPYTGVTCVKQYD